MSANERIVVQVTHTQKQQITSIAKRLGINISELMRQAALHYELISANDSEIEILFEQMQLSAAKASQAVEETLDFVAKSNQRIRKMEEAAKHGNRRKNLEYTDHSD